MPVTGSTTSSRSIGHAAELDQLRARVCELEGMLEASRRAELPCRAVPPCGGCIAQSQLLHLVDALPLVAAYIDHDGQVCFVNRAFERWYSSSRGSLVGSSLEQLFDSQEVVLQSDAHARSLQGQPVSFERESRFPDGVRRRVHISWLPYPRQQGTQGSFLLMEDVTERRRAERALTESNQGLDRRIRRATQELAYSNRALRMEIASRQDAERELRRSRDRFQDFAECGAGALWETDAGLRMKRLIPLDELFAGEGEAWVGDYPWNLLCGSVDANPQWRQIRDMFTRRCAFRDIRIGRADGEGRVRHWSVSGKPCLVEGEFIGFRGTVTDVTAEVVAKQSLECNEERYRIVTELISDLVYAFTVEADGSMRADWFVGRLTSELKQPELGAVRQHGYWRSMVHPDDRAVLRRRVDRLSAGHSSVDEFRVFALDGSVRWIRAYGKPEREADTGRIVRVIAAAQDITAQRNVEEALRINREWLDEAIESMSDGFLLFDNEGRLVACNSVVKSQFPAAAPHMSAGARYEDILAISAWAGEIREARGAVQQWLQERVRRHQTGEDTYELQTLDGRWIRATDRRTRAGGVVGLRTDISERKQAEEAIRRHERELAHALRRATMGEMASSLAHELSQPLAAIANYARGSLLRLQSDAANLAEICAVLQRACDEAERAKSIVRHVGEFVRSGTLEVRSEDLRGIVDAVAVLLDSEFRRCGIVLRIELPNHPINVRVNRVETEQVLFNLLRNGLDALREVEKDLRLLIIGAESAGTQVEVWVADNGPGVPEALHERIFEPYVTTKNNGMGMGLSISRTLVEAQGGRLRLEDVSGLGATFRFSMPAADDDPGLQRSAS